MDTTTARATSSEVLDRFLTGYWTPGTRDNEPVHLDPVARLVPRTLPGPGRGVDAAALETFIAELKTAGYAPNTIVGRVSALSAFYRWCVREELVVRNPVELIRRPSRPAESATASLTRHHSATGSPRLSSGAVRGGRPRCGFGLNGLRCGELIACNVEDPGNYSWHHTLKLTTTKSRDLSIEDPTGDRVLVQQFQRVAEVDDGHRRRRTELCPGGTQPQDPDGGPWEGHVRDQHQGALRPVPGLGRIAADRSRAGGRVMI